jgi:long-chain fatty acid transport protein
MGRASSGVASPRSASWAYMNPAALTELGRRLDLNLYTVFSETRIAPSGFIGNTISGEMASDPVEVFPTGGLVWPLPAGTLGIGFYVPMSGRLEFPYSRNIFSRVRSEGLDRRIDYLQGQLVIGYGYRFNNGWAAGIAAHASYCRFRTDHYTPLIQPVDHSMEWDASAGLGFGLGIYRRWHRFAIGASYVSRNWSSRTDIYDDLFKYTVDLPPIIQAGVAWKARHDLEFTFDIKQVRWEDVPFFANEPIDYGLGWRNQFGFKAGIEGRLLERWVLMAGYSWANAPVREKHVFANLLTPACLESYVTLGATCRLTKRTDVHLAVLHAFENRLTDSGRGNIFSFFGAGSTMACKGDVIGLGLTRYF